MTASRRTTEVTISDLSFGGAGVARTDDGQVVFVPFSAIGDRAEVRLLEVHKRYARGELVHILSASPDRLEPGCPYFGRCGGCAYQHLTYEAEMAAKRSQQRDVLLRLGGVSDLPEVEVCAAGSDRYGYRNKLRLEPVPSEHEPAEEYLRYGYCETDNRTFFAIDACPLASGALNSLLVKAPKTKWGRRNARRQRPHTMTLRETIHGETHIFFGRAPEKIPWLSEELLGREVRVPLGSFWQVNPSVASVLAETVASWCEAEPSRWLVDAYAGVGTFSLAVGGAYGQRMLIESDEEAVRAAEYNLLQWGLNSTVVSGQTERKIRDVLRRLNPLDTTVILDPPRNGCAPDVVNALLEARPRQILYVSCNVATLARDLKAILGSGGYEIHHLGLFDMFPATSHFETAIMLTRCQSPVTAVS